MQGRPLDKRAMDRILEQKHLFRGTVDEHFNSRKKLPFYFGRTEWVREGERLNEELITSVTSDAFWAMVAGVCRLDSDFLHYSKDAKPVLLAIRTENYIHKMRGGPEPPEIEIFGKINHDDIVLLDSPEKFLEFYPKAGKKSKGHYLDYFVKNYLRAGPGNQKL